MSQSTIFIIAIFMTSIYLLYNHYSYYSLFPLFLILSKDILIDFKGFHNVVKGLFKNMLMIMCWIIVFRTYFFPVNFLSIVGITSKFVKIFNQFILLSTFIPLFIISFTNPNDYKKSKLFLQIFYMFWDVPLMLWMYILSLLGLRALEPFYSEINENIIIGSMPLPGNSVDVKILNSLGVGAIVNMCLEYSGPISDYEKYDIIQHRLPTCDLCEPDYIGILHAIQFMRQYIKDNPFKRIFVHCKGGRSRAVTMTLCYCMTIPVDESEIDGDTAVNQKSIRYLTASEVILLIRKLRPVSDSRVCEYEVVKRLEFELRDHDYDFDSLYLHNLKLQV